MSGASGCRIVLVATLLLLVSAPVGAAPIPAGAEVIGDQDGPLAYRVPTSDGDWRLPEADAVLLDETWWTPLRPLAPATDGLNHPRADLLEGIRGTRLTAWSSGDVTLDGEDELVVSFRRPFKRTHINVTRPRRVWVDDEGLSAHLGLYRPGDLSEIWVAGTLVSPVVAVAACDGGLAVGYGELDEPGITETGAWSWVVFGFVPMEPLPGPGTPTCVDIDGDGRTEPAVTGRSGA